MSALVVASANEMTTMLAFSEKLALADLLPAAYRRKPANVLYAIEYGRTIGITPLAAIIGVHVIEGKPSASAALISGLVRRAGHKLRVEADDAKLTATVTIIRSDDPDFVFTSTWDMDRAKIAGLTGKQVWKNYPISMLKARAITEAARDACQEALFGLLYTPEELGATVDADGNPILSTQGEIIVGDVEEMEVKPVVTEEQATAWGQALVMTPLAGLKDVGLAINAAQGWGARTSFEGDPTLREVFVQRLGRDLLDAEVKAQVRPIFSLIQGFGLRGDEFVYADGNEDVRVLLGEFCTARGSALPETLAEPMSENAQQMQQAALDSWADDAKVVLTDAGILEGEIA